MRQLAPPNAFYAYMCIYRSLYVYLSVCTPIFLSIHLSIHLSMHIPTYLSIDFWWTRKKKKGKRYAHQHDSHTQDGTCESRCALKKSFSSMLFRVTSCVAGIDTDRTHGWGCEREH